MERDIAGRSYGRASQLPGSQQVLAAANDRIVDPMPADHQGEILSWMVVTSTDAQRNIRT